MNELWKYPHDSTWQLILEQFFKSPDGLDLITHYLNECSQYQIFPPKDDIFKALDLTPFDDVRVVILGQDPYHQPGQAMGLAFSVRDGMKFPPSLRNILEEWSKDMGHTLPKSGDLSPWAQQGVLLINNVLTVRQGQANSHLYLGWQKLTDKIIERLSGQHPSLIFVLWGKEAQKKIHLIDQSKHKVIQNVHPSPLSAYRGFIGSHPFSQINELLDPNPIDWRLDQSQFQG